MIPIDRNELFARLDKDKKELQDKLDLIKSDVELLLRDKKSKNLSHSQEIPACGTYNDHDHTKTLL